MREEKLADPTTELRLSVDGETWGCDWGRRDEWGSAAYWIDQVLRGGYEQRVDSAAAASDLLSETVFCLLGGYGVTRESAASAHQVLMAQGWRQPPSVQTVTDVLLQPLPSGTRYRFPHQRGHRIAVAWQALHSAPPVEDTYVLHAWLQTLPGVGQKTAAWIVRNTFGSDAFAIIDIWLIRALTFCGVFRPQWRVERHYDRFATAFRQYANAGGVRLSALDVCIWEQAREHPRLLPST